jgi:hypothetical protein
MNLAFKNWFKNSKVVDKKGNPIVVYHGNPDLRGFKETYIFKSRFADDKSFFFTDNYAMAKSYANPQRAWDYQNAEEGVIGLYLSLQNPLIVNANNQIWRKFETTIDGVDIVGTRDLIKYAQSKNYDGVIVQNVRDFYNDNDKKTKGGNVYVAFKESQIKLADGSNTTFDADNDDIRYEQGGTIDTGKENFAKPSDFDEWIFVHETNEEDAKSILENGFRPNQNPVITNGVYTIPKKWKDTKVGRGGVELEIKLKPNKKIFWTDSDRPMDFDTGYGNKFYVKLYKKLNKGEISPYEAYIVRGDRELWFEKKAVFKRKMENWLKENNYVGIQQGGEVVLTDLSGFTITNKLEFGGKIFNWNYSIGGL